MEHFINPKRKFCMIFNQKKTQKLAVSIPAIFFAGILHPHRIHQQTRSKGKTGTQKKQITELENPRTRAYPRFYHGQMLRICARFPKDHSCHLKEWGSPLVCFFVSEREGGPYPYKYIF